MISEFWWGGNRIKVLVDFGDFTQDTPKYTSIHFNTVVPSVLKVTECTKILRERLQFFFFKSWMISDIQSFNCDGHTNDHSILYLIFISGFFSRNAIAVKVVNKATLRTVLKRYFHHSNEVMD